MLPVRRLLLLLRPRRLPHHGCLLGRQEGVGKLQVGNHWEGWHGGQQAWLLLHGLHCPYQVVPDAHQHIQVLCYLEVGHVGLALREQCIIVLQQGQHRGQAGQGAASTVCQRLWRLAG
jgi:hypothetical protein